MAEHPLLTIDVRDTVRALTSAAKQIPFAASLMINDLLLQTYTAETAGIKATFKNPRPFTQKSVQYDKANKGNLTGVICIRPEVAKYLMPYEIGGIHVLPGTALLNPKGIELDPYGQLYNKTMTRLKGRADIFIGKIVTRKYGEINGVWQRVTITRKGKPKRGKNLAKGNRMAKIYDPAQGRLKLLIRFGDALPVKEELNFITRGVTLIMANAPAAFTAAITRAIATAR